jgi:hypothetical protein
MNENCLPVFLLSPLHNPPSRRVLDPPPLIRRIPGAKPLNLIIGVRVGNER